VEPVDWFLQQPAVLKEVPLSVSLESLVRALASLPSLVLRQALQLPRLRLSEIPDDLQKSFLVSSWSISSNAATILLKLGTESNFGCLLEWNYIDLTTRLSN